MDQILNRKCSVSNHPISLLDEEFRIKYVRGLAACLYHLSNNSPVIFMFFTVWAECIVGKEQDFHHIWKDDNKAIKTALSIHRKRFRFFL